MLRLLVYCRTSEWIVALRRLVGPGDAQTRDARLSTPIECGSRGDLSSRLKQFPLSFVLFAWEAGDPREQLLWIDRLTRSFPQARFGAAAPGLSEETEGLLREFGVLCVARNTRDLPPFVEAFFRRFDDLPRPRRSLTEEIENSLPWDLSGT